jgi:hypothetical protein
MNQSARDNIDQDNVDPWADGSRFHAALRTGRPPLDPQLVALIIAMAKMNPRWGCIRIKGEL